jgi:hypothetical protein
MAKFSVDATGDVLVFGYASGDPTGHQYQEILESLVDGDTLRILTEVSDGIKLEFTIPASKKNNVVFRECA